MTFPRFFVSASLGGAMAIAVSPSLAIQTPSHSASGRVELAPGISSLRSDRYITYNQTPAQSKNAWTSFLHATQPSEWQVIWDNATNVPHRIWGGGIFAPNTIANAAAAETHARTFFAAHINLLAPGSQPSDFDLVANDLHDGLRTVAFAQRTVLSSGERVPVFSGQLSFRYKADRLFVIASEAVPSTQFAPRTLDSKSAVQLAKQWMTRSIADPVKHPSELMVYPLARGRSFEVRTVFRVPLSIGKFTYDVFVDAHDGSRVARKARVQFASANVRFDVPLRQPQDMRLIEGAPYLNLVIDGATDITDNQGGFSWPGPADSTVDLGVEGKFVQVRNRSGSNATATIVAQDGGNVDWSMANDEVGDAQLSAFFHANVVKQRAMQIAPEMTSLSGQVPVDVNWVDSQNVCNAYWDGSSMNFFRAGFGCNNTARLADVVYHEFGHAFHQYAVIPGAGFPDQALGEGGSDYLAATITSDPEIAPGLFQSGGYLREIDTDLRWPDDVHEDPHYTGLIFAGSLWDLRTALVASLGDVQGIAHTDKLYYAVLQRASSIPATYVEVLAADDDDGNLDNGTPNLCAINQAFAKHGLTPFLDASGLSLHHDQLSVLAPDVGPYPIEVKPTRLYPQCSQSLIQTARIHLKTASGTTNIPLDVADDSLVGALPSQPAATALRYQILVTVDDIEYLLPDNRADNEYRAFVGDITPLYCNDFETQIDGWQWGDTLGASGDFRWGSPQGKAGDPLEAFSGSKVMGNDLEADGQYLARRTTYAQSPPIDILGQSNVRLQLWRWLTIEDGYYDQASIYVNDQRLWYNKASDQSGLLYHIDRQWRFEDINLSQFAQTGTSTIQVKFELASDVAFELGGWNVDDVCIVAFTNPDETPNQPAIADRFLASGGACALTDVGRDGKSGAMALLLAVATMLAVRKRGMGN